MDKVLCIEQMTQKKYKNSSFTLLFRLISVYS